ncbi:hypothetical protein ACHAW5_001967 [Stephanodiscus triporus]|uniref:Uncharacterized protein n=1 Tax=Stephanodiscus triporus TaxID=2934178 RepID=A0ABD3QRP8_9STRA
MKRSPGSSFLFVILAALLVCAHSKPIMSSSSTTTTPVLAPDHDKNDGAVVEYRREGGKRGLGRAVVDWGLSRIDRVLHGDVSVSELMSAFVNNGLHERENRSGEDSTVGFKELIGLRNRIERGCLRANDEDERSLCVSRGMEIRDRIVDLRNRRSRSANAIRRYEGMIEWCASYGNWFC